MTSVSQENGIWQFAIFLYSTGLQCMQHLLAFFLKESFFESNKESCIARLGTEH